VIYIFKFKIIQKGGLCEEIYCEYNLIDMKFDLAKTISVLERTPQVLNTLLLGLHGDWVYSNEGKDSWSPYDIIGHLIHGEITDWIPRLEIILENGVETPFEPFDRFAQFENSKGKSLEQLLTEFKELRNKNLKRLISVGITEKHLPLKGIHPEFGKITLKQLLSTWVVHDLSHLNQISRVMAKQYKEEVGEWKRYLSILK
jgi:hypothetical protein